MNFIITNHAKKRLMQRNIPFPSNRNVVPAKGKVKKAIIKNKRRAKRKNHDKPLKALIYMRGFTHNPKVVPIYVCDKQKDGALLVITAFNLYKN